MRKYWFLSFLPVILFVTGLFAQQRTVHVVTSRNNLPSSLKFNFQVNGKQFKMNDGDCLDLQTSADSLHIIFKDRQIIGKQKVKDLHTAVTDSSYIWIYLTYEGAFKTGRIVAEPICKSCYEELKAKCKKNRTEIIP